MFGFNGGVSAYIVSSATAADMLIKEFDRQIKMGANPNVICNDVFKKVGVNASDLTASDYRRVQRKVEDLWRLYNSCR